MPDADPDEEGPEANFTDAERRRIITDILCWKAELEAGQEYDREDYVQRLTNMSDPELKRAWDGTVGEWVASRPDCRPPNGISFNDWMDDQFQRVCDGEETAYGFVYSDQLGPRRDIRPSPQ